MYDFESISKVTLDSELREMLKRIIDDYNALETKYERAKAVINHAANNVKIIDNENKFSK
jgi:hypothetical protein